MLADDDTPHEIFQYRPIEEDIDHHETHAGLSKDTTYDSYVSWPEMDSIRDSRLYSEDSSLSRRWQPSTGYSSCVYTPAMIKDSRWRVLRDTNVTVTSAFRITSGQPKVLETYHVKSMCTLLFKQFHQRNEGLSPSDKDQLQVLGERSYNMLRKNIRAIARAMRG